jgi:hypothetical protein
VTGCEGNPIRKFFAVLSAKTFSSSASFVVLVLVLVLGFSGFDYENEDDDEEDWVAAMPRCALALKGFCFFRLPRRHRWPAPGGEGAV